MTQCRQTAHQRGCQTLSRLSSVAVHSHGFKGSQVHFLRNVWVFWLLLRHATSTRFTVSLAAWLGAPTRFTSRRPVIKLCQTKRCMRRLVLTVWAHKLSAMVSLPYTRLEALFWGFIATAPSILCGGRPCSYGRKEGSPRGRGLELIWSSEGNNFSECLAPN